MKIRFSSAKRSAKVAFSLKKPYLDGCSISRFFVAEKVCTRLTLGELPKPLGVNSTLL